MRNQIYNMTMSKQNLFNDAIYEFDSNNIDINKILSSNSLIVDSKSNIFEIHRLSGSSIEITYIDFNKNVNPLTRADLSSLDDVWFNYFYEKTINGNDADNVMLNYKRNIDYVFVSPLNEKYLSYDDLYICTKENNDLLFVANNKNIDIDSILSNVNSIMSFAFSDVEKFNEIELTNNQIEIYPFSFALTHLSSIHMKKCDYKLLPMGLFYGCQYLSSIAINDNCKMLECQVFSNCKNLTYVNLPSNMLSIDDDAFEYCSNLKHITLPSSLVYFGNYGIFMNCSSLISIEIPNSIDRLPNLMFHNNYSLSTIKLNDNIKIIDEDCFSNCINLTSISIPKSVIEIKQSAFDN